MKKYLIGALVLIAVVVMVKTVPEKKAHKKAMMEAVKEYVDEEAEKLGLGDDVLSNLGKGIVNKTVEVALNSKLEVDNYLLFNMTHVELDGENKILSLGILGHVFTFDKEMLRDALESSAKEKQEAKDERKAAKEAEKEAKELEEQLATCYRNTLDMCLENGLKTVAFCCISTGVFHFPNRRAAQIAVQTVSERLLNHDGRMDRVIFNVFKDEDKEYYERLLQ